MIGVSLFVTSEELLYVNIKKTSVEYEQRIILIYHIHVWLNLKSKSPMTLKPVFKIRLKIRGKSQRGLGLSIIRSTCLN